MEKSKELIDLNKRVDEIILESLMLVENIVAVKNKIGLLASLYKIGDITADLYAERLVKLRQESIDLKRRNDEIGEEADRCFLLLEAGITTIMPD